MRAMKLSKKTTAVLAAGILLASAGGAYAYWLTTGDGVGSATTGTTTAFTVTTDAATGGPLTPGGPTQTVAFHVTNPSTGVQRLNAIAVTVAGVMGAVWSSVGGCSYLDYTVGTPTLDTATYGADVLPGVKVDGTVTITMKNLPSDQNGCKGATVPLYVHAS